MREVIRYKSEVTGDVYDTEKECARADEEHLLVQGTFSFYDGCEVDGLGDGEFIQRDKDFYDRLCDGIATLTNSLHPWIKKSFDGEVTRVHAQGRRILGRYLDDGGSPLYRWWSIQASICGKCYKQYNQTFYALHCCEEL